MLLFTSISVLTSSCTIKQLVNDTRGQNGLSVLLLVRLEGTASISQVNGQVRHLEDSLLASPISRRQYSCFILYNNLSSECQISIEPCVPQSASVQLHRELLKPGSVSGLGHRSQLEYG